MNNEFEQLYEKAVAAGREAAMALTPRPMAVQATNSLTGGFDWNKPYEVVSDGVCGFAWVDIRPASPAGRNDSPFVKYLRAAKIGRYSEYDKAWKIWIGDYNQSMQKKEAHAEAMAAVLKEGGVRASAGSRMD